MRAISPNLMLAKITRYTVMLEEREDIIAMVDKQHISKGVVIDIKLLQGRSLIAFSVTTSLFCSAYLLLEFGTSLSQSLPLQRWSVTSR